MDLLMAQWSEILQKLKKEYDIMDVSYETWLKPLEVFAVENDTLYILFPQDTNQMSLNYISKRYELPLKVTIGEVTGQEY